MRATTKRSVAYLVGQFLVFLFHLVHVADHVFEFGFFLESALFGGLAILHEPTVAIDEIRFCSQINNSLNVDVIKQRQFNRSINSGFGRKSFSGASLRLSLLGWLSGVPNRQEYAYLFSRRASASSWSLSSLLSRHLRFFPESSEDPSFAMASSYLFWSITV